MKKRLILSFLVLILVFTTVSTILAAPNGFTIPWWTVDNGGGTSQGGDFAVSGTIGQPDTCPLMSGGDFTVVGGFWSGAGAPPSPNLVYLPLVIQ